MNAERIFWFIKNNERILCRKFYNVDSVQKYDFTGNFVYVRFFVYQPKSCVWLPYFLIDHKYDMWTLDIVRQDTYDWSVKF